MATAFAAMPAQAGTGAGVGNIPQGTQTDAAYARSYQTKGVTNVFATTQQTSCYRPENPYFATLSPNDGYTGMTPCGDAATTGEDTGLTPYRSQVGSNPGYPAASPMLVKDHSESDLRVDPTNPNHLIGSSKWVVSAEGYNHLLGFYESWDGGKTWPTQGHIPGYEGWTDNTDPVGAFDSYGNYYSLILPYEFYYNSDGSHNFQTNQNKEPNPSVAAEAITIAVRKHGATAADDWSTNRAGAMDVIANYPAKGKEPDKQWITIDTNPNSPHFNRIYAMWTLFNGIAAVPYFSYAQAHADGTHTPWSAPVVLPTAGSNPQGDTYLLPHVDGNGVVYTTLTNFQPKQGFCCTSILLDESTDGGLTWATVSTVIAGVSAPPLLFPNTGFRDGIEDSFTVGQRLVKGHYPLYVSWEDHSTGYNNIILSASYDGGATWSDPIQVNDNASANIDATQPNLTAAANGTISVAFYDRRLSCPAVGTVEAAGAGIALDQVNDRYSGPMPPYGAVNYCVNSTLQFYRADLAPVGHNIRISAHTFDPQLNQPKPRSIGADEGFIGDYYGNITGANLASGGLSDYTTSTSSYNDGSNPSHYQQQVIATVAVP
ncbi:MAG TPA: sialidase family protein [Candidatus Dormibacteraeota bacterium]|jgi:hypothetical protein